MRRFATAAACLALALLTFFQFPGHTWLQQDSQIYVPILEHLRDPSVLRNDMVAAQPHVAYTLYDETARALRAATGLEFHAVLAFEQVASRAAGIWGLYLMAAALGLAFGPAMLVASVCSLGATIAGAQVLTFEYEPTPRAFAVPLLVCALGLAAQRRWVGAGIAAGGAFLYHPPTVLPVWALFALLAVWPAKPGARRERLRGLIPLAVAAAVLLVFSRFEAGEGQVLWGQLTAAQESLQRMRAAYVWISTWPASAIAHHAVVFAVALAVWLRLRREMPHELSVLPAGLAVAGILSMPLSWLVLEHWKWALAPQWQPLRNLLFLTLAMQFLTAAAGAKAAFKKNWPEALAWFALSYLVPLQPVLTTGFEWRHVAVALGMAAVASAALWRSERRNWRFAPVLSVAAFFAVPVLGGVVNYPQLHTPEVTHLSEWARTATPRDSVFLFPDAARALDPGIFRSQALRAVYVDWKGGGQVNYLAGFGTEWFSRWQQTMAGRYKPRELPFYAGLGVDYLVLKPEHRLPRPALFENERYVVYSTH